MEGVKNFKQLINEYCQRIKVPIPTYVCTPDQEKNPNGFFCTLAVGDQSYCTPNWQKTKKNAELEAAKIACGKLNLEKTNAEMRAIKKAEQNPVNGKEAGERKGKTGQPESKDPEWITIEKVEDIYKYLTDEVLAQEFKAFLHCKAQEEKKGYPIFTTSEVKEKGYTAIVTYDGKQYNSLGVMMSKKQAEQSAAEVCLRCLGDFPAVPKDKYTIQVYRGGQVHLQQKKKSDSNKYTYILLGGVIGSFGYQFPRYRFKEIPDGDSTTYKAVCWFEGKVFESETATETTGEAKLLAAAEALKFLGFNEPKESADLRDILKVKKRRAFVPLGPLMSPYVYCPSKRLAWALYRFLSTDEITGEAVSVKDLEGVVDIKKSELLNPDVIMSKLLGKTPEIDGQALHSRSDLSIGEVNGEHKNIVMVGNAQCSIPMFCKNGKIRCDNRSCDVELLPGHNIRGLKCRYQLTLPSLHIYLEAESCDDLFYPNPPLPVVTSCGLAVLIYDHEATAQDIHVLLTRPSSNKTFATKARSVALCLNKLISGSQHRFSVAECTSNINTWTHTEVKLLSEMTMDSMHELMSPYVRYDDRWNEIFAKEHHDVLKELEDACSAELTRRTEEGVEMDEEVNKEPWALPCSRFKHRLMPTGVLIENNLHCTFRALLESTGLKIKLGDLEESPTVDMSCEDNTSPHRGDVSRYYIWKGLRKVSKDEVEPYYKETDIVNKIGKDWVVDAEMEKKAEKKKGKDKRRQGKQKQQEECKIVKMEEDQKTETVTDADVTDVVDDEKKSETVSPPKEEKTREPFVPKDNRGAVHEECRWFTLEEAKELCPMLTKISSTTPFQNQVTALQLDVNNFMEAKANGTLEQ